MSRPLNQLTVRGFDPELTRRIRALAKREGISLNQAVLVLLRQGAGLGNDGADEGTVGRGLERFIGTWTDDEADDLEAAVAEAFGQVDEEMWR